MFSLQSLTSHCIAGRKERFLALIATLWSEGRQRCQKWSPLTLQLQRFADNLLHEGFCSSLCRDFVKSVMQWNFYPCSAADLSLKRAALVWKIKAVRAVIRNMEHEHFSAFWAEKQQAVIRKANSEVSCAFQAERQGTVIWSRRRKKFPAQLGFKSCFPAFLLLRQYSLRSSAWSAVFRLSVIS